MNEEEANEGLVPNSDCLECFNIKNKGKVVNMKLPIENRRYSNEITADNDGEQVSIAGWIHEKRDLGGVFFSYRARP